MHIIIMLLLISLLIIVHEMGHFLVARALKIRVDRFGFGLPFGPTLWEKKIGDVTYCIHAFLLGGYVSFPDDDPESPIPLDDPGRLKNRKIWERAAVISAGVISNAVLAFVIVLGVVLFTQNIPTNKSLVYVQGFAREISIAKNAGFMVGDRIFAIEGRKINNFYEFKKILQANKADDGYVSEQDAKNMMVAIIKENSELFKSLGISTNKISNQTLDKAESLVIPKNTIVHIPDNVYQQMLLPNLKDPFSKAEVLPPEAKLSDAEMEIKKNIVNYKYSGNGIITLEELAKASVDRKHQLEITVLRKGKKVNLSVSPNKEGLLGFNREVKDVYIPVTSIGQAVDGAWGYLYQNTSFMVLGLYKIVTGQVDVRDLHGIVAITKVGGDVIKQKGLSDGWLLTALISIDLAIVNLLPIPALDGGHLMFLLIEKLRGRPVEEKYQEAFAKYGFLFLIGLMLLIVFNDIFGLVTTKF